MPLKHSQNIKADDYSLVYVETSTKSPINIIKPLSPDTVTNISVTLMVI